MGFHACVRLEQVNNYYGFFEMNDQWKQSHVFAQVTILGEYDQDETKIVTNKIRVDHLLNGKHGEWIFVDGFAQIPCEHMYSKGLKRVYKMEKTPIHYKVQKKIMSSYTASLLHKAE